MTDVTVQDEVDANDEPIRSGEGGSDTHSVPEVQSTSSARESLSGVGAALRVHRQAKGLSLRQFARQLGVSASFISQLENGKSQPSVATLFAICEALDVTVDQLFAQSASTVDRNGPTAKPIANTDASASSGGLAAHGPSGSGPVVHAADRQRLVLDTGVTWEKLSSRDAPGDFLMITYEVGGSSTAGDQLTRHSGTDYGLVVKGQLTVSLGFETYVLGPTDSISFDSSTPHRLHNEGVEPVQAIWFVLNGDDSAGPHTLLA